MTGRITARVHPA